MFDLKRQANYESLIKLNIVQVGNGCLFAAPVLVKHA